MASEICRYRGIGLVVLDDRGREVRQGELGVCNGCKGVEGRQEGTT